MMADVRALLAHREFRLLFLGQSASALGDRLVTVALALYVTQIGSPSDVGLVLAAHALPLVGFLLVGGVWADRLPRHRLMLGADAVRGTAHGLLAVLVLTGTAQVWQLVVIEAVFGSAEAVFRPAYSGLTPQTVPAALIQRAKAATSVVETLAGFVGPAVSTALFFGLGAGWAFAADAATFAVSAAFLVPMRPQPRGRAPVRGSLPGDLRAGWSEVRSRAWVWSIIAIFSVVVMCEFAPWQTLGPSVAGTVHHDRALFGVLAAVQGAGAAAGGLTGLRWRPLHPMRTGMLVTLPLPLGAAAFALGAPVAVCVAVFAIGGWGITVFMVWWETALAERIPAHVLSRVSSYDWMGSLALLPVGYLAAGPLAEAIGARSVLVGGPAIALVALASGLLVRETWTLRRVQKEATPSSGVDAVA
jgi:MFS family permease